MKSSLAIVVANLALGAGCKAQEGPQVAFLLGTAQEARPQKDAEYFEARASELDLRVVALTANNDGAKQLAQIEDVLEQGARVLVMQPTDVYDAAGYLRLAHEKGAKVIAYDRAIVAGGLDYFVAHDSYRIGVLQAEAALRATGGKGRYVILSGEAGHFVATEIERGYEDTLAPYIARFGLELVRENHHGAWSSEQARSNVENAIARAGRIDAVLASNSAMARGAVEAVTSARLDHVFIAGANADAANLNYVCQGTQTIEVLKDRDSLARTAAEIAKKLLEPAVDQSEAETSTLIAGAAVPTSIVRVVVVTPDNVKKLIVDTGVLTADALPACKDRLAVK